MSDWADEKAREIALDAENANRVLPLIAAALRAAYATGTLDARVISANAFGDLRKQLAEAEYALDFEKLRNAELFGEISTLRAKKRRKAISDLAALDGKSPEWDDLRGAAPNATDNLSSEDFVRKMRDEEWL